MVALLALPLLSGRAPQKYIFFASFLNGRAIKRGGGVDKSWSLMKNYLNFSSLKIFCCHFNEYNYFTLDNLSKYGLGFPKIGLFKSKNWGQEKNCQNPFPAILEHKKNPMAINPEIVDIRMN